MDRLFPKLKDAAEDAEVRRTLNRMYDLIAGLEGRLGAVESKPVQLSGEQQQSIARDAVSLIGVLAQPLIGATADSLLASVPQTPGTGTVTSVGLSVPSQFAVANSPIIGSGTLTVTWNTQAANKVLAGPTGGAAVAPTFRILDDADMPAKEVKTDDTFTKTVAGAPYLNDGYITLKDHAGNSVRVMTTA